MAHNDARRPRSSATRSARSATTTRGPASAWSQTAVAAPRSRRMCAPGPRMVFKTRIREQPFPESQQTIQRARTGTPAGCAIFTAVQHAECSSPPAPFKSTRTSRSGVGQMTPRAQRKKKEARPWSPGVDEDTGDGGVEQRLGPTRHDGREHVGLQQVDRGRRRDQPGREPGPQD